MENIENKDAWEAWEKDNQHHPSGINPYAYVMGYKAAQSKPADEKFLMFLVDTVWSHIYEDESVPSTELSEDLILAARAKYKDFKTQQAIYKNYPNLNASKEEMDEMRKLK